MVVSVDDLLKEKNSIISFSDTVSAILENNKNLSFHDVMQFIYRNFYIVSDDIDNSFICCSYNRLNGIYENSELVAECLKTLEYLTTSNWISGIGNENNDDFFTVYDSNGFEHGSCKEFFFYKDDVIRLLSVSGVTIHFNHGLRDECLSIEGLSDGEGCEIAERDLMVSDYENKIQKLLSENEFLKNELNRLKDKAPIHLGAFRDDDPLLLAIEIRNSEWKKYDPENEMATRGKQAAIVSALEERGFSNVQAKSIEMVACPIKRG